MRGAYVATPLPAVTVLLPPDWNPDWPFPGPYPPGFIPRTNLQFTFATPPTPEEVAPDEEFTAQVWLRDTAGNTTPNPEDGSSSISWYAILDGAVIWTTTTAWSRVQGYAGNEVTFTPPLTDGDIDKTLTLQATATVVFEKLPISVTAEVDIDIKSLLNLSVICGATALQSSDPFYWPTQQASMFLRIQTWNGETLDGHEQWQYYREGFPYGAYYQESHYTWNALPENITVTRSNWEYTIEISEINPILRYVIRIGVKAGDTPVELEGGFEAELLRGDLTVVDSLSDRDTGHIVVAYSGPTPIGYWKQAGGIMSIEAGERELTLVDSWSSDYLPWG